MIGVNGDSVDDKAKVVLCIYLYLMISSDISINLQTGHHQLWWTRKRWQVNRHLNV